MKAPEIKFDPRNYRKHSEQNKKVIKKSLQELGAGRSIVIDADDTLVAGNGVYEQAKKLKMPVRVVETDGSELVVVKRTDIHADDEKRRKLALADNAAGDLSEWNDDLLRSDWSHDALAEFGVVFPEIEIQTDTNDAQEDNFEEDNEKIEPVTKPGDIWQLGDHRLLCGDSTKTEDVQRLMQGEQAHLWLTDPPYNVSVQNSQGMTIKNDNMASDKFGEFLTKAFTAAKSVLAPGCPFYIWFASCEHINFEQALNKVGLKVRQELIWNKNAFNLGRAHYQWKHEPCLYGWQGGTCRYFIDLRNLSSVIQDEDELNIDKMTKGEMKAMLHKIYEEKIPVTVINEAKPLKDADHPTMKPVRLFGYQTRNSSRPGEIVLDTFGGSGTTIVACEQLHRKARIMELDPHYCDVIIARWEKLTGKKATKINN